MDQIVFLYIKKLSLLLILLFPSILMANHAYWVSVGINKDGIKFELNEHSIVKNNGLISFELRSQTTNKSSSLIDFFKPKLDYKLAGFVISCSEPKSNIYFVGEIDEKGNITKSSEKPIEIAALNLQSMAKESFIYTAALQYCKADLSNRNPKNLSDISMKDPQNQNEWRTISSSLSDSFKTITIFSVDSSSAMRLNDNVLQVATNTTLEKSVEMSGKRLKNILSSVHIDCKNQSHGFAMTEYFDADGALITRNKLKGGQPQFVSYDPGSPVGNAASYLCPKISLFASVGSGDDSIKTSSLNSSNSPSKTILTPEIPSPALGTRLALVIGNAGYKIRPLANPLNDANDVSSVLKSNGFEVIDIRDGNLNQMRAAVRQFGDKLLTSDVGLVYYAGHGIEVKGKNYLIPVNADIKSSDEVADQALDMSLILAKMDTAKKGVNILIVDACRDDPFGRSYRSSSRGLATMDAPQGTMIAYATAPGNVAIDGNGRNSPFTKHLVRAMQVPNTPIELMFKEVRRAVREETKNQQTPWENSSLIGNFYFTVKK